mgnify:CR=1 FL=1
MILVVIMMMIGRMFKKSPVMKNFVSGGLPDRRWQCQGQSEPLQEKRQTLPPVLTKTQPQYQCELVHQNPKQMFCQKHNRLHQNKLIVVLTKVGRKVLMVC